MEREPQDPDEHEAQESLPGQDRRGELPHEVSVEFGHLSLMPPKGGSWAEWVMTRGTTEAEREERAIDHRTARYVARFLAQATTPALAKLAATGEVDFVGLQAEIISLHVEQTDQARDWTAWLAHYCVSRTDRGPVERWRADIARQDRLEAEWLRRERTFDRIDELFQSVPPQQRLGNGADPGWSGLVRHEGRPGGWIVSEGAHGVRQVWESDSDKELEAAYVELVRAQQQWILETFGNPRGAHERGTGEARRDTPSGPPPAPDG